MTQLDPASIFARPGGLATLGDRELFRLSGVLGRDRKVADRRFLATLVEIDRRGLLKSRRAYGSIQEYGSRVGGVSAQTVTDVLNLGKAFSAHPRCWNLFASGRVGWTLLRTVAPVLGSKSDAAWATCLATGTKHGLELMVRSIREPNPEARPAGVLPGKDLPAPLPALEAESSRTPARLLPIPAGPAPAAETRAAGLGLAPALQARLEAKRQEPGPGSPAAGEALGPPPLRGRLRDPRLPSARRPSAPLGAAGLGA